MVITGRSLLGGEFQYALKYIQAVLKLQARALDWSRSGWIEREPFGADQAAGSVPVR
jgi:hypothetical protein